MGIIFLQEVQHFLLVISNGHGLGSNRTEPLSHGLMVYWFQKKLTVWFGLVWIVDKRFGLVLKLGFIGLV